MSRLKIIIENKSETILGETFPGVSQSVEVDTTNLSVHEWFKVFERILLAEGFSSSTIMKGGAQLAFNEWRSKTEMQKVYDEYDLGEFAPPAS